MQSPGRADHAAFTQQGLKVDVQADPYTIQGLVAGIIRLAQTSKLKIAQERVTASLE